MVAPSDVYSASSRKRGSVGAGTSVQEAANLAVTAVAQLIMSDTFVTDEVTIFLIAKGTNTTKVHIGDSTITTSKGAYILKTVNDNISLAINHHATNLYAIADHADGATIGISYIRAF